MDTATHHTPHSIYNPLEDIVSAFDPYERELRFSATNFGSTLSIENATGEELEVVRTDMETFSIGGKSKSVHECADAIAAHIGMLDKDRQEVQKYLRNILS